MKHFIYIFFFTVSIVSMVFINGKVNNEDGYRQSCNGP